ncbi:MAG: hypothetical protein DRJ07_12450, partial [Bacteroidetes bacterium]
MKQLIAFPLVFIFSLSIYNSVFAQFTPVNSGDVAWGDYNDDDYPDVLLTGRSIDWLISKIYKNNGDSTFTELTELNLPGVYASSVAWFDYDNNGELDFIIAGRSEDGSPITKIYKNNGDETFIEQSTNLPGIQDGSINCFDFDNDGYPDVLLGGYDGSGYLTKLYKNNNGDGTFSEETAANLPASIDKTVTVGDYDNDGYIDILIYGVLYKNNSGDGTFIEQNTVTSGLIRGDLGLFFDYNNDNYPDLIISNVSYSGFTIIYENIIPLSLPTFYIPVDTIAHINEDGTISVLDYNNDTYLDIIIVGDTAGYNSSAISRVYKNNNGNGTFSIDPSINIIPLGTTTAIACGDYNDDDNTDFIISGRYEGEPITKLYSNTGTNNFKTKGVSIPEQFSTFDPLHNVWISSGEFADYDNDGFQDFIIIGLDNDSEYITKIYKNNGDNTFSEQKQIQLHDVYNGSVSWGDYNNDNYQDILITGRDKDNNIISKIYKNNGNNTFSEQTQIELIGIYYGSVAWGDYNNDNYLDILLCGRDDFNERRSIIYKNDQNGNFEEQTQIELIGVYNSSVAWGDYNNDNYLDILLTGNSANGEISKIYKNNGNGTFTEQTQTGLTDVYAGAVAWGDYDNDNYLDILLTGYTVTESISKVYKNNGDGSFTDQTQINLKGIFFGSVKWCDYNNDNNLDFIIAGRDDSDDTYSKVYKNNGDNTFTEQLQIEITPMRSGSLDCADINNDGYKDLLLTGRTNIDGIQTAVTQIYVNNKKENLIRLDYNFQALENSFVSFADFDKNGHIDMLMTGQDSDTLENSALYTTTNYGFQSTNITVPVLKNGSTSWGDYNNDGYCDLIITGKNELGLAQTLILQNSGNNKFMESGIYVSGVYDGFAEWADYNNDGLLDFVLSGNTGSNLITKVYKNTGNGFVETVTSFPGSHHAVWSDCNNDGLWDILLADINAYTKIYENKGNNQFQLTLNFGDIANISFLDFSIFDYNNDAYDDIFIYKNDKLYFLKNQGDGTFPGADILVDNSYLFSNSINYFSTGDFNIDGIPDLLFNNQRYNGDLMLKLYEFTNT